VGVQHARTRGRRRAAIVLYMFTQKDTSTVCTCAARSHGTAELLRIFSRRLTDKQDSMQLLLSPCLDTKKFLVKMSHQMFRAMLEEVFKY
jgi:hypothetical protein